MQLNFPIPYLFLCFFLWTLSLPSLAQTKELTSAERYYAAKQYEQAFPFFEQAIKAGNKDPLIHYKTGQCLYRSSDLNKQIKAIPYFEYVIQNSGDMPPNVHVELAETYLKNEDLKKAYFGFNIAKAQSPGDKGIVRRAEQGLAATRSAQTFMAMPRKFTVKSLSDEINTPYTEYGPVVSADESILAFTALRPNPDATSTQKTIEQLLISERQGDQFFKPKVVSIGGESNVGTAGISADGQQMIVFMSGINDPGNLFQVTREGTAWTKPVSLAPSINSKSTETTASITPDGKVIYFASDRPGGKGGLDIYKITKQESGGWSPPENLGSPVNTDADEDAPFIHPDQRTLYFTGNGHNTMGGRDIFRTTVVEGMWTKPENMGYPVNSTANDNYFSLLANGKRAYFASDRKGGKGSQDIYYVDMPNENTSALTMLKGKILEAETGKPIPTKIYLLDNETNQKLDFVYNPNPTTGAYLIILPPAKNYDMVIESEGYLPYTLNINIPNQTYFYELFQLIQLKTIKQFDVLVGQEVSVFNAFYDNKKLLKGAARTGAHAATYDQMMRLMIATEPAEIEKLTQTIQASGHMSAEDMRKNADAEVATRTYFYDESDESKFEKKTIDGQVIFSLPTFMVTEEAKKQKSSQPAVSSMDKRLLAKQVKVFFDAGKTEVKDSFKPSLDVLWKDLEQYPTLGIEISGFASSEGTEELNREISNKRAIAVLEYFNFKGVVRRRIVAKGYGATTGTQSTGAKEESRRVEVRLVELK
jgi:outer membrane protein OmpA-like peptidoglycan-associated protein